MKITKPVLLFVSMLMPFILTGCGGGVQETLGLEKEAPDEFRVIKRAPLEMPSTTALPPPQRGVPRPQESSPVEQARQSVFGQEKHAKKEDDLSASEAALLQRSGAEQADPHIREIVNAETSEMSDRNQSVASKLLGMTGNDEKPSASVVNAKEELERIQKALKEGESVTGEGSPAIEE